MIKVPDFLRAQISSLFVILGAGLWATDTLFRHPMAQQISPLSIVFLEHVFAASLALIWLLLAHRKARFFLSSKEMLGTAVIGVFGSGVATLLFTSSFHYINPSVAILLQKVQPLIVITLSALFLNEKLTRSFFGWAALALASAYFISFPQGIKAEDLTGLGSSANAIGSLLALAAATFWAISTVVGKAVLHSVNNSVLTFWRFFFGLIALYAMVSNHTQSQIELPFIYSDYTILRSIFAMAFISGFLGITFYYRGLSKVPASIATVLELSFPLCAMWVNARFLDVHLTNTQLVAAGVLLLSMVGISRNQR